MDGFYTVPEAAKALCDDEWAIRKAADKLKKERPELGIATLGYVRIIPASSLEAVRQIILRRIRKGPKKRRKNPARSRAEVVFE